MHVCAALLILTGPAAADDWPFFRGPYCNGVSAETGWPEPVQTVAAWLGHSPKVAVANYLRMHAVLHKRSSGWGGIRTPVAVSRQAVFKTAALVHSATHPKAVVATTYGE